jgi:BTB/POZ domain
MPNADVVLQSANHVNFCVHKSALAVSSPLFRDMFSLPQPPDDETVNGLPVVHLSEDADVLNSLISMMYPVPPEIPDADDSVLALLAASQKYDMVAVQSSIRAEVSRKGLLSPKGAEAFRVYAIACRKRLIPEMETTARLTLDYPMTFKYVGEALRLFEGWALRDLANFRQRCSDRLNSCIQSFLDCRNGPSKIWVGCPGPLPFFGACEPKNHPGFPPTWLQNLLWKLEPLDALSVQTLNPSQFRKKYLEALHAHVNEKDCHFCMKVHTLQGEAFCAEIEKEMVQARNVQYSFFEGIPYESERRSQFVSIH